VKKAMMVNKEEGEHVEKELSYLQRSTRQESVLLVEWWVDGCMCREAVPLSPSFAIEVEPT
jgi:hypothetical protein